MLLYCAYLMGGASAVQGVVILIVISAILLALSICDWRYNWFTLLLAIAFTLGTYQLQLHRNAAFSLLFVVAIFWIFQRLQTTRMKWMIWLYPPLIGLWGTIHGSYLLGLALIVLLFFGNAIDTLMGSAKAGLSQFGQPLLVIIAAFSLTLVWNPMTAMFLMRPFRHLHSYYARQMPVPEPSKARDSTGSSPEALPRDANTIASSVSPIQTPTPGAGKASDLNTAALDSRSDAQRNFPDARSCSPVGSARYKGRSHKAISERVDLAAN